jgi:hypothetical protein
MTIHVKDVSYDNKRELLTVEIPVGHKDYGVLDGGHTYQVIRKNATANGNGDTESETKKKDPEFFNGHVNIEIMQGLSEELIAEIAGARNTSAQVKSFSIANLEGQFEWIKLALHGQPYANKIAYRENEDDNMFPIDVTEIVGFATMFHPLFNDSDNPPILSYSGKGRALEMFVSEDEKIQAGYASIGAILKDILKLYDFVHMNFAPMYEQLGGFSGVRDRAHGSDRERKGVKLGQVKEVKFYDHGFKLYYLDKAAGYKFPDGWLYPIVGALRMLVDYKPKYSTWKMDPFEFFSKHGKKLVEMTLEKANNIGRTPAAIGKDKSHWTLMADRVSLLAAKVKGE